MDIINNLFKDNDKELKDAKEDFRKIKNEDVKILLPKPIDVILNYDKMIILKQQK